LWVIIISNENNWNDWNYPLDYPKSLIKVDWKTIIESHIDMINDAKLNNVILAVWDMWEQIKKFVEKNYKNNNIKIENFDKNDWTWEIINSISKKYNFNKYLVILWDNYHNNFNLIDFIHYHNTSDTDLSIIVKVIDSSSWYWNIKLEWNDVVRFVEKPQSKDDISFIVNAWIYLIWENILRENISIKKIETELFPWYVKKHKTKAYFHNWNWFHMQDNKTLGLFK
jgi:NDP-sugar pyrophosphorylase family protein